MSSMPQSILLDDAAWHRLFDREPSRTPPHLDLLPPAFAWLWETTRRLQLPSGGRAEVILEPGAEPDVRNGVIAIAPPRSKNDDRAVVLLSHELGHLICDALGRTPHAITQQLRRDVRPSDERHRRLLVRTFHEAEAWAFAAALLQRAEGFCAWDLFHDEAMRGLQTYVDATTNARHSP